MMSLSVAEDFLGRADLVLNGHGGPVTATGRQILPLQATAAHGAVAFGSLTVEVRRNNVSIEQVWLL